MIDPKLQTLSQLFNGDFQFVIPDYQRPYSWKDQEVAELVEDISSHVGKSSGLYLGTMIFDVSSLPNKTIEVVDGQQRLTSLFLLLIACRDHANAIGHPERAQATQQKITFTDEIENKAIGMKMLASASIKTVFEVMADSKWNGAFAPDLSKLAVRKVRPLYEYFRKRIKQLTADQLGQFQAAIYATQVLRINIASKDEAFAIFERTNARGMDLEVADLLKNFLHQNNVKAIRESWTKILKNASSSMLRMRKAFHVASCGSIQKAELYRGLKKYAEGFEKAEGFVDELLEFSDFYAYAATASTNSEVTKDYFASFMLSGVAKHHDRFFEAHSAMQALKFFKVTQPQAVIFACMVAMRRLEQGDDTQAAKSFVRMLKAIECFHFINTYICSHIGNEVEGFYAQSAELFRKSSDLSKSIESFISGLRGKLAKNSEFKESFQAIEYSPNQTGRLAYIFDRFNNQTRKPAEKKPMFYPDSQMLFTHFNIEHISPQTQAVPAPKMLNNIGNLMLMSVQLNSELGNKEVKKKFELMRGKLKARVTEFPEIVATVEKFATDERMLMNNDTFWSDKEISERSSELATRAYSTIWAF